MGENKSSEGKDLVFVYPNDIRGRGYMLQYVLGVTGIEPSVLDGKQVVHTVNGDRIIGVGYIRVAEHI